LSKSLGVEFNDDGSRSTKGAKPAGENALPAFVDGLVQETWIGAIRSGQVRGKWTATKRRSRRKALEKTAGERSRDKSEKAQENGFEGEQPAPMRRIAVCHGSGQRDHD
jgi:hypothetical protein